MGIYHVYALITQEPTFDSRKMTPNPDAVVEIYNKDGLLLFQTSSLEGEEDYSNQQNCDRTGSRSPTH